MPDICNECQELEQADCTEPTLDLDLDNGTYTVTIKDNNSGNIYTQSIEVTDGGVDWDGTNTAGVFTPYSVFTVTIADSNGDPVTWTSGYVDYNCVRLTFTPTINTTPVD
jgi:flagellar hook assembly protein FlgD